MYAVGRRVRRQGWVARVYECNTYADTPVFSNHTSVEDAVVIGNCPVSSTQYSMYLAGSGAAPPLGARVCYSVAVAAVNSVGVGAFSTLSSTVQGNARPGAPTILGVFPGACSSRSSGSCSSRSSGSCSSRSSGSCASMFAPPVTRKLAVAPTVW